MAKGKTAEFEDWKPGDGTKRITKVDLKNGKVRDAFLRPRDLQDALVLETLGVMGLYQSFVNGRAAAFAGEDWQRMAEGILPETVNLSGVQLRTKMSELAKSLAGDDEGLHKAIAALGL